MRKVLLCVLLSALAWAGPAAAVTCNASGSIAFGAYDPQSASADLAIGSVIVTCDKNANVTIRLGLGNGAGASYSTGRRMTRAAGGTLIYNLYADAARSQVFGDGSPGTVTRNMSKGSSYNQPVWGSMPGSQKGALPGGYNDTVLVTISY